MHTLQPFKIVSSSSRCTDYVEVRHPGFGVTESCGTEPGANRLQLGEGGRMKYAVYSYFWASCHQDFKSWHKLEK